MEYLNSKQRGRNPLFHPPPPPEEKKSMIATLRKATLSFLRVCINLTNSSSQICEFLNNNNNKDLSLAKLLVNTITSNPQHYSDADHHHHSRTAPKDSPTLAREEQEKPESRFELLLLSLGLMINFIQESDLVKDRILSTPLANDIKTVFETLITRDVPPLPPQFHFLR
jgi:hypothetical protein